jgi:acetyl esterase/lipase
MPHTITGSPDLPSRRRILLTTGSAIAVAGCAPVAALNAFAGRDAGASRVATGVAFGSHPRQTLDIYAPINARGPSPVVVFLYGGSWNNGTREDYAFVGHALAARGYVTVIPDYRLVPEVVFPVFLDDNASAVRWVRDGIGRHGGDARRLALVGHSAGAYNAVMLGLDRTIGGRAGLSPALIKAVVGLSGPYDFLPFTSPAAVAAFGNWSPLSETQPVSLSRAGAPPMFLATGDADTVVSPKNTRALAAALRKAGASVAERIYPDVGHAGTLTPFAPSFRGNATVVDDVTAFLDLRVGERRRA